MYVTERPKRLSGIQNLTTSGTAALSAAIATGVVPDVAVRISATAAVYFLIGTAPVATSANGALLAAGATELVKVTPGDKISVIQVTAGGIFSLAVVE